MKSVLFVLVTIFSISAFATNPKTIWCDKDRFFGPLTRVEFNKVDTTSYEMTVYKENRCQSSGCSYLKPVLSKVVRLFESPVTRELIITPGFDRSDDDISIYTQSGKCKVKLAEGFRFRGKVVRIDNE